MGHHFVLVHGTYHGACELYKLADRLEKDGQKAIALDLAGCGIHPADPNTITTYSEYLRPLKDFMASSLSVEKNDEKVIKLSQIMQRQFPTRMLFTGCITYTPERQEQVPWVYIKCSQDRVNIPAQQKYFAEILVRLQRLLRSTLATWPFYRRLMSSLALWTSIS